MFKKLKFLLSPQTVRQLYRDIAWMVLDGFLYGTVFSLVFYIINLLMTKQLQSQHLLIATGIAVPCYVLRFLITRKSFYGLQVHGSDATATLRLRMGDKIRDLGLGYFQQQNMGEISNTMTNNLEDLELILTHYLPEVVKSLVFILYLSVVLFFFSPFIALVQILFGLAVFVIGIFASKRVREVGLESKRQRSIMIARIVEYVSSIAVFKSFGMANERFERLSKSIDEVRRYSIKLELSGVPYVACMSVLTSLSFPIVLVIAVHRYVVGGLTVEQLIPILICSMAVTVIAMALTAMFVEVRYFTTAITRLEGILRLPAMPYTQKDCVLESHDICLDHVSFSYLDEKTVIKDLSFVAKEGTKTALVGLSGSGKSTVLNLIARFWDVDSGSVRIGGQDVRQFEPDALLQHISMVFQDVYLLDDSIYENIRMGREDVSLSDIEEAAKIAQCHDFIMALPEGYQTKIHEGGNSLSGGEKQRISIARALVKKAPIILLDEATASLDVDNEYAFQQALRHLTKNKTVIVIAHRLQTICDADQIIVLRDGSLHEQGSHAKLMEENGWYAQMFQEMHEAQNWKLLTKGCVSQ